MRRRILSLAVLLVVAGAVTATALAAGGGGTRRLVRRAATVPTVRLAGMQHFCGTNGVNCSDTALNWEEYKGFDVAEKNGAPLWEYIGHDEPMLQFFSDKPGSGNDVTYRLPVSVWREAIERHFPQSAWLRLGRTHFDRLCTFKARRGLPSWDAAVDALLEGREEP